MDDTLLICRKEAAIWR